MSPTSYQTATTPRCEFPPVYQLGIRYATHVRKQRELYHQTFLTIMAQKLGFEPRCRSHDLPVFKTGPFSHLGTSAYVQFVDPVGFEPTTFRLEGECSIQLS